MAARAVPEMRDLVEVDMYAQSFMWKHPEIETVILRPVNIVGPTVRNAPSNYLRLERPLTVMGFDPMLQVIHERGRLPRASRSRSSRASAASST